MVVLFDLFYRWLERFLENIFGNFTYEPLKVLLLSPYFWLIIIALLVLELIFRRR